VQVDVGKCARERRAPTPLRIPRGGCQIVSTGSIVQVWSISVLVVLNYEDPVHGVTFLTVKKKLDPVYGVYRPRTRVFCSVD